MRRQMPAEAPWEDLGFASAADFCASHEGGPGSVHASANPLSTNRPLRDSLLNRGSGPLRDSLLEGGGAAWPEAAGVGGGAAMGFVEGDVVDL